MEKRSQGHGIGRLLLRAMLELFVEMRDRVGCIDVVVDAKQDVVEFNSVQGIQPIDFMSGSPGDRPVPVAMFLTVQQSAVVTKRERG